MYFFKMRGAIVGSDSLRITAAVGSTVGGTVGGTVGLVL